MAAEPRLAPELHHRIPRCLLRLYDRALMHPDFDGQGIELWLEFEHEALRSGVDVETLSREDLAALIEASTVAVGEEEHRAAHSAAGDFARWGRRSGLETLRRYGPSWFRLLALRRWERIPAEDLATPPLD